MRRIFLFCLAIVLCSVVAAPAEAFVAPQPVVASPQPPGSADRVALIWHDCDADLVGWECATLRAPRDWGNLADPRNVHVEMARKKATGDQPIGALTFNPGGPGSSGLAYAQEFYDKLPDSIRKNFDFVAWDPRGVGLSRPLMLCSPPGHTSSQVRTGQYEYDWNMWRELATEVLDASATANQSCIQQSNIAAYMGTWFVIRDLDALRAQLGYATWNIWGQSYGTRIGYRYAREFPTRVRTMVLDGAMDPDMTVGSWASGVGSGLTYAQSVFTSLFGKKMAIKFSRIMNRLANGPIVINGTKWTQTSFGRATLGKMPFQHNYPLIVQTINDVYKGIFAKSSTRQLDPSANVFALTMVNCADINGRPDAVHVARLAQTAQLNGGEYAGSVVLSASTTCAGIPEGFGGHPYVAPDHPLTLSIPPLVVNSLGDWRTPWAGAREMANRFTGSTLLTYGGTQHITYMETPSACINLTVTAYLLTAEVPSPRTCPYVPSEQP